MKKAVYPVVGLLVESLGWMSALFICSEYLVPAVEVRLGKTYFLTYGKAARPYMALYFLAVFVLLTLCLVLLHRLTPLKSSAAAANPDRGKSSVAGLHAFVLCLFIRDFD